MLKVAVNDRSFLGVTTAYSLPRCAAQASFMHHRLYAFPILLKSAEVVRISRPHIQPNDTRVSVHPCSCRSSAPVPPHCPCWISVLEHVSRLPSTFKPSVLPVQPHHLHREHPRHDATTKTVWLLSQCTPLLSAASETPWMMPNDHDGFIVAVHRISDLSEMVCATFNL